MPQDEWIRAAEAVTMLEPILGEYSARLRICARAHAGLIRSRAEQFHQGQRIFHDHDIPKEFWWAEGRGALEQDWPTGDFSTWIDRRVQWKAFGVTFARADIQRLLPAQNSAKTEAVEPAQVIVSVARGTMPRGSRVKLRNAILESFDLVSLDRVLRDNDMLHPNIATGPDFEARVDSLIEVARQQGWLIELCDALAAARSGNAPVRSAILAVRQSLPD